MPSAGESILKGLGGLAKVARLLLTPIALPIAVAASAVLLTTWATLWSMNLCWSEYFKKKFEEFNLKFDPQLDAAQKRAFEAFQNLWIKFGFWFFLAAANQIEEGATNTQDAIHDAAPLLEVPSTWQELTSAEERERVQQDAKEAVQAKKSIVAGKIPGSSPAHSFGAGMNANQHEIEV